MQKKFSNKQKVKILPIAFLVALIFVYLIAFKETISLNRNCKELEKQVLLANDAPQQIIAVQNKLNEINTIAGKDTLTSGTDPLLEFISKQNATYNCGLVDYQPMHIYQNQNYTVETRVASMDGSFVTLLKLLYNIENRFKSGKLVSVNFHTETNYKTDRKRLLMTIYVQTIKSGSIKPNANQNGNNHE